MKAILKYLSTKARRRKVYECEINMDSLSYNFIRGMNIELKLFGLFWIIITEYSVLNNYIWKK